MAHHSASVGEEHLIGCCVLAHPVEAIRPLLFCGLRFRPLPAHHSPASVGTSTLGRRPSTSSPKMPKKNPAANHPPLLRFLLPAATPDITPKIRPMPMYSTISLLLSR